MNRFLRCATSAPLTALAALVIGGCAANPSVPSVAVDLVATRGNAVSGQVRFEQTGDKVRVSGEVKGLKPNAEHGFHVHEKGDCSSGDGVSAGGHFNPDGQPHGAYDHGAHHAGDLPSLRADASGVARFDFESGALSLLAAPTDLHGKGLIVHRDPDDFTTQPTGNSGPRVACGVIANTETAQIKSGY